MTYLKLVPEHHIEKLEKEQHEKFHNMLDSHMKSKRRSMKTKEQWLEIFRRCLSPQLACKQTQLSIKTYQRWRKTDPWFCRKLNEIIEEAHEEMIGSAYARATGYYKPDLETESGFEEDATGRPIRHGMSDRLAIAMINGSQRAAEQSPSNVTVVINWEALGITPSGKKCLDGSNVLPFAQSGEENEIIEGELADDGPDDPPAA